MRDRGRPAPNLRGRGAQERDVRRADAAQAMHCFSDMAHILILFASSYGHTRKIAWAIDRELRHRGHTVDLLDVRMDDPSPTEYDAVVIGSRVRFGRHAPAIRRYVERHRAELDEVASAFFSVSMAAAGPGPAPYLEEFIAETGWRPQLSSSFAGALLYRQYNPLLRFVMKRLSRKEGHTTDTSRDHEFTDWKAVRAFAGAFAIAVERAAPDTGAVPIAVERAAPDTGVAHAAR